MNVGLNGRSTAVDGLLTSAAQVGVCNLKREIKRITEDYKHPRRERKYSGRKSNIRSGLLPRRDSTE